MPRKTRISASAYACRRRARTTSGPWRPRGTSASCAQRSRRRGPANDGIGEPGFTHAGHFRCAIWNAMPLFFAPSAVRSGAPRFAPPAPRYVWQLRQPDDREELRARDRLLVVREPLLLRPRRHVADELRAERLLRGRALVGEDAHRDDDEDRRDDRDRAGASSRRSARMSMNGSASSRIEQHRRDADRAEDDRLRPLEDPQQVEEEVEVPVGPRDEVDRSRVGRRVVELAEPARLGACGGRPASSTSRRSRAR